jgi:hypothetical protein
MRGSCFVRWGICIVHGESFLARVPTIFQIWNPLVANEILSSHKFIYEYHVTNSLQRI